MTTADLPQEVSSHKNAGGYAVTAKSMVIVDCGKKIKSSKKKICWTLGMCAFDRQFTLVDSIVSGRKQVFVNDVRVHDSRSDIREWHHTFAIMNFKIHIFIDPKPGKTRPTYNLSVNDVPYHRLRRGSIFEKGSSPPPAPPPGAPPTKERSNKTVMGKARRNDRGRRGEDDKEDSEAMSGADHSMETSKNLKKKSKRRSSKKMGKPTVKESHEQSHVRRDSVDSYDPFAAQDSYMHDGATAGFENDFEDFGDVDDFVFPPQANNNLSDMSQAPHTQQPLQMFSNNNKETPNNNLNPFSGF